MSHAVKVVDDDKHFLIDSFTRQVSSEYSKLMITNGDHNSERFTFEAPQNIEGHDMSECNSIEVHYVNINKTKTERVEGIYVVDDLSVKDGGIFFSWLLSRNCTSLVGTLQFSVKFKCLDEDNNVDYEWNTTLFKNVTVLESISNSEAISEKYPDIFEQFKDDVIDEVANTQKSLVKSVNQNLPDLSGNVEIETGGSSVPKPLTYDYMPEGYPSKKTIGTVTAMEEQELSFSSGDAPLPVDIDLKEGITYIVVLDGVQYECVCALFEGYPYLGNPVEFGGVDTGQPFLCFPVEGGFFVYADKESSSSTHTVGITEILQVATPMATEFLPSIPADKLPSSPIVILDNSLAGSITGSSTPHYNFTNLTFDELYNAVSKGLILIQDTSGAIYSPLEYEIFNGNIFLSIIVSVNYVYHFVELSCSNGNTTFIRNRIKKITTSEI